MIDGVGSNCHSTTLSHFLVQSSSAARSAQNPSGSFDRALVHGLVLGLALDPGARRPFGLWLDNDAFSGLRCHPLHLRRGCSLAVFRATLRAPGRVFVAGAPCGARATRPIARPAREEPAAGQRSTLLSMQRRRNRQNGQSRGGAVPCRRYAAARSRTHVRVQARDGACALPRRPGPAGPAAAAAAVPRQMRDGEGPLRPAHEQGPCRHAPAPRRRGSDGRLGARPRRPAARPPQAVSEAAVSRTPGRGESSRRGSGDGAARPPGRTRKWPAGSSKREVTPHGRGIFEAEPAVEAGRRRSRRRAGNGAGQGQAAAHEGPADAAPLQLGCDGHRRQGERRPGAAAGHESQRGSAWRGRRPRPAESATTEAVTRRSRSRRTISRASSSWPKAARTVRSIAGRSAGRARQRRRSRGGPGRGAASASAERLSRTWLTRLGNVVGNVGFEPTTSCV